MTGPTRANWRARLSLIGFAALLALAALTMTTPLAHARVWVNVGAPFPGYYYGPGPYYGYPPPYAYAPAPGYYYPQPGYYPDPAGYPTTGPAASAYTPDQPTTGYAPPTGAAAPSASAYGPYQPSAAGPAPTSAAAPAAPATAGVTYTNKPAFTNSAGQTCHEYKTTSGGRDVFGTACQQADGQWRVVN